MCELELEPCEVWRETYRTARKEHRCSSCGGPIRGGEKYRDHFSIFEGHRTSQRACATCAADMDAFGKEHGTWPIPSHLAETLQECIADGDEESERVWKPMLEALRARMVPNQAVSP
jgi:hypothetical protein